jgi:hypothetical protein
MLCSKQQQTNGIHSAVDSALSSAIVSRFTAKLFFQLFKGTVTNRNVILQNRATFPGLLLETISRIMMTDKYKE